MLSNILDRISFWSLFSVIVILPLFFLPFTGIPIENAKNLLLVVGLAITVIAWAAARFSDGEIVIPKSWVLLSGAVVTLVFLVSSLLSGGAEISMFGIMLDTGTFWFMFASFMLMLVSALIIKDEKKGKIIFYGLLSSFVFILFFQILRFIMPNTLSFGVFGGKAGNLFGSWNSFGILVGLVNLMALFAVEFLDVSRKVKLLMGGIVVFTLIMAAVVNFSLVWTLLGIFAMVIFIYRISLSSRREASFPAFSFAVVIVSLLFVMSGQFIGSYLPNLIGVSDSEVGPSFSSTMTIAKATFKTDPLFGVGPNRFAEAWAMYKPAIINQSLFWDSSFNYGSGLIPTLAITTGIMGVLAWFAFIVLFLINGVKTIFTAMKKSLGYEVSIFFLIALYMLASLFFYSAGSASFLLTFALLGVYIGISSSVKEEREWSLSFVDGTKRKFFTILSLVFIMIASAGVSFKFLERFASVYYFENAITTKEINVAEKAISKAILLYPNDLYYRTYSNVYLAKLSNLIYKDSALTDVEKEELKFDLDSTINGAGLAANYNPKNYLNFQSLGAIYYSTGLFGSEGAYDNAIAAYQKASELNPLNPGLKLSIANAYLQQDKTKEARDYATEALTLKGDFVDAMIVLAKVEKKSGNQQLAVSYAEQALALYPGNKDLNDFVTLIKTGSVPTSTPEATTPAENNTKDTNPTP